MIPAGEFTWGAAGAWASFVALLGVIARQVGPWRKISLDAEKDFRDDLISRVTKLEKDLQDERDRSETERKVRQARHDAERAIDRHRINNLQTCFDALMMMLKASPREVLSIVENIERLRAEQLKAEAVEKAAIHVAAIQSAEPQAD